MNRLLAAVAATATTVLAAAALALAPATAGAKPANLTRAVIRDCTRSATGALQNRYSARVLRIALRAVRGDVAEYTGCRDAIRRQLRRARATLSVGLRLRPRGPLARGRIALTYGRRARTVDALDVRAGRRATFKVVPGTYVARVAGRRRCTLRVVARRGRTVRAVVTCRR